MKKKSASQSAPARRSPGESGFFKLGVLLGVLMCFAAVTIVLLAQPGTPSGQSGSSQTPAGCQYTFTTGTDTIVEGTTDTGNHCDDCSTAITFPFPVSVYGQTFNSANVASDGSLDLIGAQSPFTHGCQVLPSTLWTMAIFPYQDDLRTDNIGFTGCNVFPGATCGVFTSVTGTAPNRQFNIEWRATHFADTTTSANFEVVFYENSQTFFDVIYGATSDNGLDETSGVQQSSTGPATTFSCGTSTLTNGLKVTYTCAGGGTPSPTPTPTASPSCTPIVVTGSIDAGDPLQTDRLFRSGIPQTCPATTTCAIFGDSTPRHYDSYTFTNTTGATQCVTVDTNTACTGTNFIFIAAYLGSFDPNNLCTNWIGDSGGSPNPDQPFQFNLDNGQTVVVVVSEITPDAGCPAYTVTITGFCLPTVIPAGAKAVVADFNGDNHPDWVVRNVNTRQTVLVYLNDNVVIGAALGPTLTSNLALTGAADFNLDTHPDYALFAPNTFQTLLEYLSGPILIGAAFGPTLPAGWELVTTADFNGDNNPDFVIFKRSTRQTAIVFLNNNIVLGAALLLTLPAGWNLGAFADFNSDGHIDIALFNPATRQTVIGYLSGAILIGAALGPTLPMNWQLVAAADFNGDGHPDYLLYRPDTRQTEIWHLNNNVFINAVSGLTLPSGWTLLSH